MWNNDNTLFLAAIIAAFSSCDVPQTSPEAADPEPGREPAVPTIELHEGTVDLSGLPGMFRPTDRSGAESPEDEKDRDEHQE